MAEMGWLIVNLNYEERQTNIFAKMCDESNHSFAVTVCARFSFSLLRSVIYISFIAD